MEQIKHKLLPFQINHVNNLVRIIKNNITCFDGSDTGTGKTYTALAACNILNLKPIILCPKSVVNSWKKIAESFNVKPKFVVNYETIKFGKYYSSKGNRIKCPYIKIIDEKENENKTSTYKWILDKEDTNIIFIFDEVHKCSNLATQNGQLLYSAKLTSMPMLILSATISDSFEKFRLFLWILNFLNPEDVKRRNYTFDQYMVIVTKWLIRDKDPMLRIHNMLYPNRATRMRIDAIGIMFPEGHVSAEPVTIGKTREEAIEKQYTVIANELDALKDKSKKDKTNSLVKILRAHQKIEIIKAPIFVEIVNDYLENKYSVVLFVNFTQTLKLLSKMLNTESLIHGSQTATERENIIQAFQENKSRIVICNIKTAPGISLHDIYGGHPRVSLISPTWSSTDLLQALGRIHRAGAKSPALQRIIYIANTVEEDIADKLKAKLTAIRTINDGDLNLLGITFKKKF